MPFAPKPNSALLIVGHGSTENPDSSTPYFEHADEIRKRGLFAEVHCCFWKEEPSMREALYMIDAEEVYIVPDFISEGYFTQDVIPREFGITGPTTLVGGKILHYCLPVGVHPSMTGLILRRAREVAPGIDPAETTLIITGHGTGLNQNSTKAIRDQVDQIIASNEGFKHVTDAFMEEEPLIAGWDEMSPTPNVIVVPFFISDGLHSYQDIPVLLGIESEVGAAASQREVFRHNPHHLRGKTLYYSSAIGTERLIADVILDQISDFDNQYKPQEFSRSSTIFPEESITHYLTRLLEKKVHRIGEIEIQTGASCEQLCEQIGEQPCEQLFILSHERDASNVRSGEVSAFEIHRDPMVARDLSTYAPDGEYRFTKGQVNLRAGWVMILSSAEDLRLALDHFYPAAIGLHRASASGKLAVQNLREKLERQTGMYRSARFISDAGAQQLVRETCGPTNQCAKRILWQLDGSTALEDSEASRFDGISSGLPGTEVIPLLCQEACNHFVSQCRKVSKKEHDAKKLSAS
ncbi:MAG TPA: CbiX/SirB N-terminal domain-containing protein [Luteolibacter sp.]|nr:CbiX/SirB N-terminal domain-containing protein [Luteolibacter sp.]